MDPGDCQNRLIGHSIGAIELKRTYQRNFTIGILCAATLHIAAVGGYALYRDWKATTPVPTTEPEVIVSITDFGPPPSLNRTRPMQPALGEVAPPTLGIPKPVPDAEVTEEVRFPTREEMEVLSSMNPVEGLYEAGNWDSIIVPTDLAEYLPGPEEFVAFQENPTAINPIPPDYPEMARLTGREGAVILKALVDKTGNVRDVRILKSSGSNAGFDEAAVAAAYKTVYRPAIQNGQPVAVWITYRVEFNLD